MLDPLEELNADKRSIEIFESHESFGLAIIGGIGLSMLMAVIWAIITVITEYQLGLIAIVVGVVIGFGIRFFGSGVSIKFGLLGGFLALLACFSGNLFSQIGFLAKYQGIPIADVMGYIGMSDLSSMITESFSAMDLFFYAIAAYEGYKFAFRPITYELLDAVKEDREKSVPLYLNLKKPLAIASLLIVIGAFLFLNRPLSGEKEFFYETGDIQSKGNYRDGLEEGTWQFFHENGSRSGEGEYSNGVQIGNWNWYDENSTLSTSATFKKGLLDGTYVNYHQDGSVLDSGHYVNGRMNGEWVGYNENRQTAFEGIYDKDKEDGLWKYYHINGALQSEGKYKNGDKLEIWKTYYENSSPESIIEYLDESKMNIISYWSRYGEQMVIDSKGKHETYHPNKILASQGSIENGVKVGLWKIFNNQGRIIQEYRYNNNEELLWSAWDNLGKRQIENGNGQFLDRDSLGNILTSGQVKDGFYKGEWKYYYPESETLMIKTLYSDNGKTAQYSYYFQSGELYFQGVEKNGIRDETWEWFYENGNTESIVNYIDGKKEGDQLFYSETGIETKKEIYKDGELIDEIIL